MGFGRLKPARAEAEAKADDEVLCDLDVVISRRVTFTFRGQTHVVEPITSQRFFDFWHAVESFKSTKHKTPDESNKGFHKLMRTVCKTLTLSDVEKMSEVQKGDLVCHVAAKVMGNKDAIARPEKKTPVTPTTPHV